MVRDRAKYIIALIAFVIIGMGIYYGLFWPLAQDEGVFLAIAKGVQKGLLPYHDYFDHKSPGIYYFLSVATYFSGNSLIGARLVIALVNIITGIILFWIAKRYWGRQAAIFSTIFYLGLLPVFEGYLILTEPIMSLFLTIGLCYWLKGMRDCKSSYFLLSGLGIGMAALFKQTAIINGLVLGGLIFCLSRLSLKITATVFCLGLLLIWLPWFIFFFTSGAGRDFFLQVIWLNFTSYPQTDINLVLDGWRHLLLVSLPLWILVIIGLVGVGKRLVRSGLKFTPELAIGLNILAVLPWLLFRQYPHYWIQILPFAALAAGHQLSLVSRYNLGKVGLNVASLIVLLWLSYITFDFVDNTKTEKVPLLNEQLKMGEDVIKSDVGKNIYTSSFFSGIYFLTNKKPASRYLYTNELNIHMGAPEKVRNDLKHVKPELVVWSIKQPRTIDSARVRDFIAENYTLKKTYNLNQVELYRINEQ